MMPTYHAPRSSSCAARATAVGLRRQGISRPLRRALGPQRRQLPSRRSSPRSREQAARLGGVSNLFYTEPAMLLAERLAESSLGGRVFLAQLRCRGERVRDQARPPAAPTPAASIVPEIVVLEQAFHGRTLAALAATPRLAREDLFGPLPAGFVSVPRDDPAALARRSANDRGGVGRADPGRGRGLPIGDEVLTAARHACDAGRRAAGLRRDPDGDGQDRDPVGL